MQPSAPPPAGVVAGPPLAIEITNHSDAPGGEGSGDEPPSLASGIEVAVPSRVDEILPADLSPDLSPSLPPSLAPNGDVAVATARGGDRLARRVLVVVDQPRLFPLQLPTLAGEVAEVVPVRRYLTDEAFATLPRARVLNLCRSYRYQTLGYYTSLLATARGHQPLPSIDTIQEVKLPALVRGASEALAGLVARSLAAVEGTRFDLDIHFGRTANPAFTRLAGAIFARFPAPFLRANFQRDAPAEPWSLESLRLLAVGDLPEADRPFAAEQAARFLLKPPRPRRSPQPNRFELAILRDPREATPPSNERAIRRFLAAAAELKIGVELVGREDAARLAEFDALLIRETTAVDHHTYRISRRAAAEGLVVIDDPESIVRCGNKVFLAELLARHRVATPRTLVVSRENAAAVASEIGFPVVFKQPDSAFSKGVVKFDVVAEFEAALPTLFRDSELLIAQAFVPTEFDWRIGVLAGQPLFACRYFMARQHWQIVKHSGSRMEPGHVETLPVDRAPAAVVNLAVRAARLIGDGLYGVDLKVVEGRPVVIEVNDNPNIDAGIEDAVLGDFLYERILRHLSDRVEARRRLE